MTYLPHTDIDRKVMLEAIGLSSMAELFADVPERMPLPRARSCRRQRPKWRSPGKCRNWRTNNINRPASASFLGAGTYHHYSPPTVDYVLRRGEFYTSYTPYQPEISQGMLQAMFEYQSMICQLTGMDVSNASHYDGATALAEAVLLALDGPRATGRQIFSPLPLHPQYREVVQTYLRGVGAEVLGGEDSGADIADLKALLDGRTAALVIQNPNFFGQFEDVHGLAEAVHAVGRCSDRRRRSDFPRTVSAAGDYGADIVVAEGQPLGIPLSFGGPHLGIFATRQEHVRRLAGRLVGETVDAEGRRGYVLTLATREQHIRRAKATSNICTNAALMALGAAVYLATLGKSGLRQVAELCYHKSHYAAAQIAPAARLRDQPAGAGRPSSRSSSSGCRGRSPR